MINKLFLILLFSGCAAEKKADFVEFELPAVKDFDSTPWSGADSAGETAAVVNGAKIYASAVKRLKKANPEKSATEILDDLIDLELLAQEAFSRKYYPNGAEMIEAFKTALAQAYLEKRFEKDLTPESIDNEELKKLWANNNVKQLFNHPDWYSIRDMQWFCCEKGSPACESAEAGNCFLYGETAMKEIHGWIKDMKFENGKFAEYMESVKEKYPKVSLKEYSFFYDRSRPADKQKGYLIFDIPIYEAASRLGKGDLSAPVKSGYGWHILFARDYKPEERRTLDDQEVVAEIRKMFYEPFRKKEFMALIAELKKKYSAQTFYDNLKSGSSR